MPPVYIHYRRDEHESPLVQAATSLRDHIADQLSTPERLLDRGEVSMQIIKSLGEGMIADVTMLILAAPHTQRIEQQDEICDSVREFMLGQIPELQDAKVWLALPELGYSFGQ